MTRPRPHRRRPPRLRPALAAALALAAAGCGGERPRPGTPPRHALLITVAGLRADHVSALQYARDTTASPAGDAVHPRDVDDLAAGGVLFGAAFAPAGEPSVALAALHLGRSPLASGVRAPGDGWPAGARPLAEAFDAAGFRCAAFVSGGQDLPADLARGFAPFEAADHDAAAVAAAEAYLTAGAADPAPLFLWVHLAEPAFPFDPGPLPGPDGVPLDFARRFLDPDDGGTADGGAALRAAVAAGERSLDAADRARIVALYDGEVARANALVGRLLAALEAGDRTPATLVVLAGAGGLELFEEGGWGSPDGVRDAHLRVPLVLHHPPSLTGRRVLGAVVELADVAPTLAQWFGLEWSDGRSLLALTDSYVRRAFPRRPAVGLSVARGLWSARDPDFRLVVDEGALRGGQGHLELHPVRLSEELPANEGSGRPQVVARLRAALLQQLSQLPAAGSDG